MKGGSNNSYRPASRISLGFITIFSRPVVFSGGYVSGAAESHFRVWAVRLNQVHMVMVVGQIIVVVVMACNIKIALLDQVY